MLLLDVMRQNVRSWATYVLFGILIIVFAFTFNMSGPGASACDPGRSAVTLAVVGGVDISAQTFGLADELSIDPPRPGADDPLAEYSYRGTRFGRLWAAQAYGNFGIDRSQVPPIKAEKLMDLLIENGVVSAQARDMGLEISTDELTDALFAGENGRTFYDDDGQFRRSVWESTIREQYRTSPSRFEEFVRQELLRSKLIELLVGGTQVTPEEMAYEHRLQNEKVNLGFIAVDDVAASALMPVDAAARDAFVSSGADEIKAYFDSHAADYKKPERRKLRGIFFKAENKARIEAEKDAAEKAKLQKSRDDAKAKAAGALAELKTAAAPPPPAPAAVPAPEPEKATPPVRRGEKRGEPNPAREAPKPGGTKPLPAPLEKPPEVKPATEGEKPPAAKPLAEEGGAPPPTPPAAVPAPAPIPTGAVPAPAPTPTGAVPAPAPRPPADPAMAAFIAKAQELSEDPSKHKDGLLDKQSKDDLRTLGVQVADAAFALQVGGLSEVVETFNGFWILRLEAITPAEDIPLETARAEIATKLLKEKGLAEFKQKLAGEVLAAAKAEPEKPLAEIAKAVNQKYGVAPKEAAEDEPAADLKADETGMFGRARFLGLGGTRTSLYGHIPKLGESKELTRAAFRATAQKPHLDKVFEVGSRQVISRWIGHEDAPPLDDEAKQEMTRALVRGKQDLFYRGWVAQQKKKAAVDYSSEWDELKKRARAAYYEAGGKAAPGAPAEGESGTAPPPAPVEGASKSK
jgi:parvulin-like peptidyl-prolyl isomerase